MNRLTDSERAMLEYALDLAQDQIYSEDDFTEEDQEALNSLRRLQGGAMGENQ